MEELTKHISAFPIIGFILGGFIVYSGLKFIKIALLRLVGNSKYISKINRFYSSIELLTGILYIVWIIPYFLEINMGIGIILSIILIISIAIVFWYAGRDFISGFILKSNSGFKINSRIKTDFLDGVIIDFYSRNLKLINDKGEKLLIPYSNLINKNILIKNRTKSRISKHITIKTNSVDNYDTLIKELKFMIMMHPKSLVNFTPSITILSQENNICTVDINISARDNNGLAEIETYIKDKLNKA